MRVVTGSANVLSRQERRAILPLDTRKSGLKLCSTFDRCELSDRVAFTLARTSTSVITLHLGYIRRINRLQQASKDAIDLEPCRRALWTDFKQCREAFACGTGSDE